MRKIILLFGVFALITACKSLSEKSKLDNLNNQANSSLTVMKGYQPLDPIQIKIQKKIGDTIDMKQLIHELPNESTRVAMGRLSQSGSITFGPLSVAKEGQTYAVIIDYVKYINTSIPTRYLEDGNFMKYKEFVNRYQSLEGTIRKIPEELKGYNVKITKSELTTNSGLVNSSSFELMPPNSKDLGSQRSVNHLVNLPVYVGVGVRIQATFTVVKDSVNMSSLYGIATAATQNDLIGTLVIQALGISGKSISPLMPVSDEISKSSVQAALMSLSSIKSKMYDDETTIYPQVIAFGLPYNILGARDLVESTLITQPPELNVDKNLDLTFTAIEFND